MIAARHVLLAMAALGLGGCAALNRSTLAPKSRAVADRTLDIDQFVAEHNRNADLIQSLDARPTIAVHSKIMKVQADGKLGMVRPQSFKLELTHMGQKKADIGSNDEEFWFWVQSDEDRSIYWCNYNDLGIECAVGHLSAGLDHGSPRPEADHAGGGRHDPRAENR